MEKRGSKNGHKKYRFLSGFCDPLEQEMAQKRMLQKVKTKVFSVHVLLEKAIFLPNFKSPHWDFLLFFFEKNAFFS